ncbi:hypothetical protein QY97_00681 [Bacillus thermotolerans]|nr:hypothetical protein QY97_00681 [Bacillus thermotolerans]
MKTSGCLALVIPHFPLRDKAEFCFKKRASLLFKRGLAPCA